MSYFHGWISDFGSWSLHSIVQSGRWFRSVGSEDYAIALQDHSFPLVLIALAKLNIIYKNW